MILSRIQNQTQIEKLGDIAIIVFITKNTIISINKVNGQIT